MCGFAGVVAWEDKFRVTRETLSRMSAAVAHRGPDGEGLYLNHEEKVTPDRPQVGLVHRRLAILDPDPRANQPFTDEQGRWIVFNGEIYNFRKLRDELSKLNPDYAWRTNCDTEVLLVAYDVWGEQCVDHMNGMFAFAVWDEPNKLLFLARDRMGQKPLYFTSEGESGGIAFASELSALGSVPWIDRTIAGADVMEYLRWGYFQSPHTIYAHIHQLPPASTTACVRGRRRTPRVYFDPNRSIGERFDDSRVVHETRLLLTQAVKRQLVSDVPLGCFLSGGIDSSIVAACMKRVINPGQRVLTFSIGFNDSRYDETQWAARVAGHLGTTHHRFEVTPRAADDLPRLARVFGQPFADSSALPTNYLARETRHDVKVALSGDGGDELFGGYDRYRALALTERLAATPIVGRLARSPAWQALPGVHPKSRSVRLKRLLAGVSLPSGERYAQYTELFSTALAAEILNQEPDNLTAQRFRSLQNAGEIVPAALALDRVSYLPDDLLTKVDRASMLHALEVRSPFMDHELVQFASGLTTDQLLRGGAKRMLREAFAQDLPAWVFKRKKMGFAVPIGEWFRGELRSMLRDNLFASDSFASSHFNRKVVERLVDEHERSIVDHSQRLYALLMLELWWKTSK